MSAELNKYLICWLKSARFPLYLLIFIFIFLLSCQKEIQIDLNTVSPLVVVEGSISNQPGPNIVKISSSVNYDETNTFPGITGATVKISDNLGNSETLTEPSPGVYSSTKLPGIPGRTYTLSILINGKEYNAVSKMPYPVNINSATFESESLEFVGDEPHKHVTISFNDPADTDNYYRFVEIYSNNRFSSVTVMSDRFRDGKEISRDVRIDFTSQIRIDRRILIEMESIDKGTYDFFRTFHRVISGDGLGILSASPSNPISNISNGALGYFSAYSATYKTVVIPYEVN
jgi:hypothetical protein